MTETGKVFWVWKMTYDSGRLLVTFFFCVIALCYLCVSVAGVNVPTYSTCARVSLLVGLEETLKGGWNLYIDYET